MCLLLTMYCSFWFINDRVCHELYIHCISVYGYVFVWMCKLCLPVFVWGTCVVFVYMYEKKCCIVWSHVWMAPGKISCEFTGSLSLKKVFELNIIWVWFKGVTQIHLVCIYSNNKMHLEQTSLRKCTCCISYIKIMFNQNACYLCCTLNLCSSNAFRIIGCLYGAWYLPLFCLALFKIYCVAFFNCLVEMF